SLELCRCGGVVAGAARGCAAGSGAVVAAPGRDGARFLLPPRHSPGHANGRPGRGGHTDGRGSVERAAGTGSRGSVLAVRRGASFAAARGGGREATRGGAVPDERRPRGGARAGVRRPAHGAGQRSEEHTSELQSREKLV